jgi:hypothetical protein
LSGWNFHKKKTFGTLNRGHKGRMKEHRATMGAVEEGSGRGRGKGHGWVVRPSSSSRTACCLVLVLVVVGHSWKKMEDGWALRVSAIGALYKRRDGAGGVDEGNVAEGTTGSELK